MARMDANGDGVCVEEHTARVLVGTVASIRPRVAWFSDVGLQSLIVTNGLTLLAPMPLATVRLVPDGLVATDRRCSPSNSSFRSPPNTLAVGRVTTAKEFETIPMYALRWRRVQ
jgi:hypothetical protein